MLHVVRMLASTDDPVDRHEIGEAVDRADAMLRGLLHPDMSEQEASSDAAVVLRGCATRLAAAAHPCSLHLEIEAEPSRVPTTALDLERVVTNLVVNSADASDPDSPIRVRLSHDGDTAVIEVIDVGRGMPRSELAQARQTGFSTKVDGTGLGLVVVDAIVSGIGGSLALRAVTGSGTTAVCRLPLSPKEGSNPTVDHTE